jgi:Long-chain acyl-CoA synthetases (AMP-forming)
MEPQTLNDIFFAIVDRRRERLMLAREGTSWLPISSQDFYRNVAGVARALRNWGVGNDDRVAILSENRPEWPVADFASLLVGAVVVPIYSTLTAQQTSYILCDSKAKIVFVSTADQLKKVLSIKDETVLEKVVVMDSVSAADAAPMSQLMQKGPIGRDSELEGLARLITSDNLASIIYTSGTTAFQKEFSSRTAI